MYKPTDEVIRKRARRLAQLLQQRLENYAFEEVSTRQLGFVAEGKDSPATSYLQHLHAALSEVVCEIHNGELLSSGLVDKDDVTLPLPKDWQP